MKKINLTIVLIALSAAIFGQDWSINGNFGITPLNFLGTQNNARLNFRTNNTQRLMINGNNNLNNIAFPNGNNTGYIGAGLNNN